MGHLADDPKRPGMHLIAGGGSAGEVAGEGFLLVRLDRTLAVPCADPADCFMWRLAAEDGETGERSPRATVAAVAADLDVLALPSPVEQRLQNLDNRNWIVRHAEVWPVQELVGPRWLPPLVEVQPEVRRYIAGVGIDAAEGHGSQLRAVRQDDATAV